MTLRPMLLLAALLGLARPAAAQDDGHPVGLWAGYSAGVQAGESPVSFHLDLQLRHADLAGDFEQFDLKASARYTLPDQPAAFALGYGLGLTDPPDESTRRLSENRVYEEVRLRQAVGPVRVEHRVRYEQRFVKGQDFQTRYRLSVGLSVPLTPGGPVSAVASNEVFLRGAGRGERPVFDRDRVFGGLGVRLGSRLQVQGGLLAQVYAEVVDPQILVSLSQSFRL